MALSTLILLRHGVTQWNAESRMQGHRDIPISADGLAQAAAAAPSVAALQPGLVVCSDLQRARETARVVGEPIGLTPRVDLRLRETNLGEWEGLTRAEVVARWPGQWEQWRHGGAHISPPGGEARIEVARRAGALVADLDREVAGTALLVTHGGLIVSLTGSLLGLPEDEWGRFTGVGNCHWVVLNRVDTGWRLRTYNGGLGGVVWPDGDVADD